MLDRLTALLSGWATRRNVLLVVALDLIMNAALLPLASARLAVLSGGIGPLDNLFTYTPAQAYSALAAYGPAGRAFDLSSELTLDLVYPLIYSLFFCLASLYFLQRTASNRPALARLALIPFLALAADYLENAGLVALLLNYPTRLSALAEVTGRLQPSSGRCKASAWRCWSSRPSARCWRGASARGRPSHDGAALGQPGWPGWRWLARCWRAATPTSSGPSVSDRATGLAQTAAALLTSTAAASFTPMTPTVPPTADRHANAQPPPRARHQYAGAHHDTATPCTNNDAAFVSDVTIPDGTHIAAGVAFTKTWRLSNSGQCPWTTAYTLRNVGGELMGGATLNLPHGVPAGATLDLSIAFVAPAGAGKHISRWQLFTPEGVAFGTKPFVQIMVP